MKAAFALIVSLYCYSCVAGQQLSENKFHPALTIYLNCEDCYPDFVKTEIKFVNYVRSIQDADVDLFITNQSAGNAAMEYTLFFIGLKTFKNINDTLKYITKAGSPEDDTRRELVQVIKLGLMRYVSHTIYAPSIQIGMNEREQADTNNAAGADKWKCWIIELNGNANLNEEKSSLVQDYSGSIIANKTTEKIKMEMGVRKGYSSNSYNNGENTVNTFTQSQSAYVQGIKSINPHWSYGVFGNTGSGTFSNQKLYTTVAPALEYNLFPYSLSQQKLFTITYLLKANYFEYSDTTIYGKIRENAFQNKLNLSLSVTQPWGSVNLFLSGSYYLMHRDKNHLTLFVNTSLHVFKGIYFNLFIGYELVHDQISLSKDGASEQELILHQREIATSYLFNMNTGITYRFGSKYNNVVNPRLNNGE